MSLKIGLTGGIGSGKSLCARIFSMHGIPVFNSDLVARDLIQNDEDTQISLKLAFGKDYFLSNGKPDRQKLASLVFSEPEALVNLNAIVHPAVFKAYAHWLDNLPADTPYSIKEAAILFESGANRNADKIISVVSPLELRLKRSMKRDGATRAQIEQRMSRQMTDAERELRSDYIIHNDEKTSILLQVSYLHNQFVKMTR